MKKYLLIIFFLYLVILPISAFNLPDFNTIDIAGLDQMLVSFDTAGLDQILITFFFQDSQGLIWVGSENGLYRYDGREITSFQYDYLDKNSLSHNYVSSIAERSDQTMWIGTAGGGVCLFDRKTGKCKRYDIDREELSNRNFVTKILVTKNKILYVSTLDGLYFYNDGEDRFDHIQNEKGEEQFIIRTMIEISNEILMLGTAKGLEFLNMNDHKFQDVSNFADLNEELSVFSFIKLSDGNILIGEDGGIFVFDPDTGKVLSFKHYFGIDLPVRDAIFYSFLENNNALYMATGKGLVVKNENNKIDHLLKGSAVTSLFIDRSGVFWVGDYYGGVKKYSVFKSRFKEDDIINSFVENKKVTISSFKESDNYYWAGTTNEGLFRIDKSNGHYKKIQIHEKRVKTRLGDKHVRSLVVDRDKTLWIGTSKGLKYLKGIDSDQNKQNLNVEEAEFKLTSKNISSIFHDSSGLIWVGTQKGLNCINKKDNSVKYFYSITDGEKSLTSDWITVISEDKSGDIWIGTLNGLNKFIKSSGKIVKFKAEEDDPASLSFNDITDIVTDSDGRVWISTWSGGLNCYIDGKDHFKTFSTIHGLLSNSIMSIIEGNKGDIWISTTIGISKYDKAEDSFTNYTGLDGLKTLNYFYQSKFRSGSGKVYFFGYQDVGIINEKKMEKSYYTPEVLVTSVESGGGKPEKQQISIPDKQKKRVSYKKKNFLISFAALDYNIPEKNQYAYRVDSIDRENEWHYIGNENKVTFFTLPDGNNRIYVKGTNSDGVWNPEPTYIDIEIVPPFWRTLWFKFFLLILASFTIFLLFQLRLRIMIRKMEYNTRLEYFCNKNNISSREKDIMKLLIEGKSNKEIEEVLFISSNTVRNHVYNIYQKLGIQKRVQLIKLFEVTHSDSVDKS